MSSNQFAARRVLAVFPHPDDEAWAAGGLLQRAGEALLVTMTRGEAGRDRVAGRRGEALASVRVAELEAACAALGIPSPIVLGLPDAAIDPADGAARLAPIIAAFAPDVIVGFDHDGGYGHVDHVACVEATLRAASPLPKVCVLGAAFPDGLLAPFRDGVAGRRPELLHARFRGARLGRAGADLVLQLTPEEAQRKRRAIAAHASQLRTPGEAGVGEFLGPGVVAQLLVEERVNVLAATPREALAGATLVHCHHALHWPEAAALARELGVPAVKTVHVLQARQSRMRGLTAPTRSETLQARALDEAHRLTIGTHAARAMLLEDHPDLDPERVRVLPLAPRLPPLPRADADGPIVAVTRFDALKGTDLLVALVPRLLRAPGRRVVIAGGLPYNPRAERRWREAFDAALAPDQRQRLVLAGWLAPGALAALLASARLFVTTSRLETFALALVEAIAAGCPAVATDLAVHHEVAGRFAWYAPPEVEALHDAIEARLASPAHRRAEPAPTDADIARRWLHFWRQTG